MGVTLRIARLPNRDSSGFGESGATGILDGVSFHAIDRRGFRPCVGRGAVLPVSKLLSSAQTVLTLVPQEAVAMVVRSMVVVGELFMSEIPPQK